MNELQDLSGVLAQNDPCGMPYRVPQDYFEQLPEKMLERVNDPAALPASSQPYTVPQGYFEGLADNVLNRIKAMESGFADEELKAISPLLSGLNKTMPYEVPAGYFEELAGNVTDGAKAIDLVNEELENLSPLMNSLRNKKAYTVPGGYFENLPDRMLAKVQEGQSAKVVSISFRSRIVRLAAAAIVTGLIVLAGWLFRNNPVQPAAGEIVNKGNPGTVIPVTISDEEIEQFLKEETLNTDAVAATDVQELKAENVNDMLADVSDEELEQFIGSNGDTNTELTN